MHKMNDLTILDEKQSKSTLSASTRKQPKSRYLKEKMQMPIETKTRNIRQKKIY